MRLHTTDKIAAVFLTVLMAGGETIAADLGAASTGAVTVAIPMGAHRITPTARGDEVTAEGFGSLLVPGKPHLPSRIFAVAIPPGTEVVAVSLEAGEGVTLPGTFSVPPAPLPRVIGREDPAIYEQDLARYQRNYDSVYGSDEVYPSEVVGLVRTAGYRKYNLVDVRVSPFSYRPLSKQLIHYPEITVQVSYRPTEAAHAAVVDALVTTEETARRIIRNYDRIRDSYPQDPPRARGLHDFVIITLDSLVSAVAPLVDWETAKGRTVEVVTTSWIAANYPGYDLAEKMRNFLRDKYPSAAWGIEDVLLVGHYDDVPMRRTWQDLGYGKPETDFYYAELSLPDDQSWDADGDHQYGEDTDPVDFYAEVNVGRIPWTDATSVLNICRKSVSYEQNQDPAFKRNALLLGGFFWNNDPYPRTDTAVLMEAIANQPWMSDWTITRMHEKNADCWSYYACDQPLLHENVLSAWQSTTYAFVNYAGHGSPISSHILGLGAPPMIESADCPSLDDAYPAIIFADACSNSDTDHDNIGRAMMGSGAVGFLGATKVATGCPDWQTPLDGSTQSLDYYFATSVTSRSYTLGQAHQWALRQMYTNGLWGYPAYEMFEWGALAGNPNLGMAPTFLDITLPEPVPEYLQPHAPTGFSVRIEEGIETCVPGTELLHYRHDGGTWHTAPLTQQGGSLFLATLPAPTCGDAPEYYISAEGSLSGVITAPFDAPATTYAAEVAHVSTFMEETFDTDPGWTTQGQWAYGQPTGAGGEYGGPDPTSGITGSNVYGYNLSGDYESNLRETHVTSPPIDCTGRFGVSLSFGRWLGVGQPPYDHASLRVSNDGVNWTTWQNAAEIADREWTYGEFDISAIADDQPTVYLRWTVASDDAWHYCGWNIDDVRLTSRTCLGTVPAVSEWGLFAMSVLMLTAGTLVFARRRQAT